MARNQSSEVVGSSAFQAPEGFRRSGTANAVGWFNQAKGGNLLRGKLLGMFTRKDQLRPEGTSNFFQVQVSEPCEVRAERGDDATMVTCKAGDVVNVNYGPKTKPWADYSSDIKRGAEIEVIAHANGRKIKIGGGRSMHDIDVFEKVLVAPSADAAIDADFEGSADAEAQV